MKKVRLNMCLFLVLQFFAAVSFAEIVTKRSTFVPHQAGIYNLEISIARNTRTGESLIAWQKTLSNEQQSDIFVRLVNSNGKPITSPQIISGQEGSSFVSVAYNPILDEYVAVYDNSFFGRTSAGSSIFARRLTPRGQPNGEEIIVSNDSISQNMSNLIPKIAFHPKTGGYIVVWLRNVEPLTKDCGLVGTLLSQTLERTGSVKMIRKSKEFPQFPLPQSIAFLPEGRKLLVTVKQFVEGSGPSAKSDYLLATLDPMLKKIRKSNVAKINIERIPQVHDSATLALTPNGSGVIFFVDHNRIIKAREIDNKGKLKGNERDAFNSPKTGTELLNPVVAFSTNANNTVGLLIATEPGQHIIWAQLLDSKGKAAGSPVEVHRMADNEGIRSASLNDLPGKPGSYRFQWYGTLEELVSGSIDSSAILQLKLTVKD